MKDVLKPAVRKWLYAVGIAVTAFLGIKGLLSAQEVDALNLLLSAVLGLAFLNVPSDGEV